MSLVAPIVAIVAHSDRDGPCYFAQFLEEHAVTYTVLHPHRPSAQCPCTTKDVLLCRRHEGKMEVDCQQIVSASEKRKEDLAEEGSASELKPYFLAGVCVLGGAMSANDPLPYYDPLFALIRDCVAHDVPFLGICLGGQILSRALGGVVGPSPPRDGLRGGACSESCTARGRRLVWGRLYNQGACNGTGRISPFLLAV